MLPELSADAVVLDLERRMENIKTIDHALGKLDVLWSILTLEYHDKNHLYFGTNPKRLNEEQRELLTDIKRDLLELRNAKP